jgi:hypothetical protein
MSDDQSGAKVISFPRQLRVVPIEAEANATPVTVSPAAVEYDGRTYDLEALLRQLPPDCIREVEATAPRSGQEFWDEVVRRWPGTAAEVVAGVVPIDQDGALAPERTTCWP